MKPIEWMPFLGDAFWESDSVAVMDDTGVALYVWLLWRQFKQESLPGPEVLSKLPHRWQGKKWSKAWPQVAPCFPVGTDGRLRNPVCAKHREEMLERVETARAKSLKGVQARAEKRGVAQPQVNGSAQPQVKPGHDPGSTTGQPLTGPDQTGKTVPSELARAARSVPRNGSKRTEHGAAHQAAIDWWCSTFEAVCGRSYGFDAGKDGAHVKAILGFAHDDLEEVKARALILLHAAPEWIDEGGKDLGTLRSQWNKLVSVGTGRTSGAKQLAIQDAARVPQSSGLLDLPTARRT